MFKMTSQVGFLLSRWMPSRARPPIFLSPNPEVHSYTTKRQTPKYLPLAPSPLFAAIFRLPLCAQIVAEQRPPSASAAGSGQAYDRAVSAGSLGLQVVEGLAVLAAVPAILTAREFRFLFALLRLGWPCPRGELVHAMVCFWGFENCFVSCSSFLVLEKL